MLHNEQHHEIMRTTKAFVEKEINPYVKEWEEAIIFPAKKLFKKWALWAY